MILWLVPLLDVNKNCAFSSWEVLLLGNVKLSKAYLCFYIVLFIFDEERLPFGSSEAYFYIGQWNLH